MVEDQTVEVDGYSELKDMRFEVDPIDPSFTFCFWVYLLNSTPFPSTILKQGNSDNKRSAPLLILNKEKKLTAFSSHILYEDRGSVSVAELSCSSVEEVPLGKWSHVGYVVSSSYIRLQIDGKVVGERYLKSIPQEVCENSNSGKVVFSFVDQENGGICGYVHDAKILLTSETIKNHQAKDPPLQLSICSSPGSEIQEDNDGAWSIVYGKQGDSRNNFSVDVLLLNAFGELVDKEFEVVASLIYADDHPQLGKPNDAQSPLVISSDGTEFSSSDVSSKLTRGCATFKLKISQLPSKCDNKLFRLRFSIAKMGSHSFFEAISPPIRCISRNPFTKASTIMWKRLPSSVHLVNGSGPHGQGNEYTEHQLNGVCQAISYPASKRVKLGPRDASEFIKIDHIQDHQDQECDLHASQACKAHNALETSLGDKQEDFGETENCASDSEGIRARSIFKNKLQTEDIISELTVFRYCLGSLSEKSAFLEAIIPYASEEQLGDLAEQVALYTGCSRHRLQISIAKRLFEEGERVWSFISQNNHCVHWDDKVSEIKEQFIEISGCHARSLTQQDITFLRRISGCNEYMVRENFDKMWRWLYPVAFTISRDGINRLWSSTAPKWIEGFITKEEVEYALQNPVNLQGVGTFILRFPASRSWPHPDAGSLVVTYVNRDYALRHRVLSLDYSCGKSVAQTKSLEELLLEEPELSRLARIDS
ncbi:hypothetical protein Droror1_Dr00027892 [Drosera rotundifolia]